MPDELLGLKEQLQKLHAAYEDALANKKPTKELEPLRRQILDIQEKIIKLYERLSKGSGWGTGNKKQ